MEHAHKFQKLCQALSEMPIYSVFHNIYSVLASLTKPLYVFYYQLRVKSYLLFSNMNY